jgi:glycosyltransferase involved in cell wall biosynthesis
VIAYRHGSVPEVIDEGVTGFVVDSEEKPCAVRRLGETLARAEWLRKNDPQTRIAEGKPTRDRRMRG